MRRTSRHPKKSPPNYQSAQLFPITAENGVVFRSMLETLEVGVAHATLNGIILYANPYFAEMLGQKRREIAGKPLRKFFSVEGWRSLEEALVRGSRGRAEGTMRVAGDGILGHRIIRLSFCPLDYDNTQSIEIVATEETELIQTAKALARSEASLQSVSARLLQIQDEERRRLSRDLHDTTGQELSVIIMTLDGIARQLGEPCNERRKAVTECADRLRKVESEIRTLSYVLHPPLLDEMGLASALQWYVDGFSKRTGIRVTTEIPVLPRFSLDKETALFRVSQEALTNVFRHSGSARAHVSLCLKPGCVEVSVCDEGKGFRSEDAPVTARSGVGIQSMKGRLEVVGGNLSVYSTAKGTTVKATVPIEADELIDRNASDSGAHVAAPEAGAEATDPNRKQRVLIADDHQIARRGIRVLFDTQPDLEICGEASDGYEAVAQAKELQPDLVILDLTMPHMGGFTAASEIRRAGLPAKILIYTSHSFSRLEDTARAAGCDGYVIKSDATHDLIRATRTVLSGGKFYRSERASSHTA